jgi:hypothetical protein
MYRHYALQRSNPDGMALGSSRAAVTDLVLRAVGRRRAL